MSERMTDQAMDAALEKKRTALHAQADENRDGRIDDADLKAQLDRIEAQLELQDAQNRQLLHHSRIRFGLSLATIVVLCCFIGVMWTRMNSAFNRINAACDEIDSITTTLTETINLLDSDQLAAMMEDLPQIMDSLPQIMDSLSQVDVAALNQVMDKLPATMDSVNALQQQIASISSFVNGLGSLTSGLGLTGGRTG